MRLSKSPTASPAPGNGVALEVPEGGFVWAINKGNDWPALIESAVGNEWYYDDAHKAMPDYTSVACDTMTPTFGAGWSATRSASRASIWRGRRSRRTRPSWAGTSRITSAPPHGNLPTDSDR